MTNSADTHPTTRQPTPGSAITSTIALFSATNWAVWAFCEYYFLQNCKVVG